MQTTPNDVYEDSGSDGKHTWLERIRVRVRIRVTASQQVVVHRIDEHYLTSGKDLTYTVEGIETISKGCFEIVRKGHGTHRRTLILCPYLGGNTLEWIRRLFVVCESWVSGR